MLIEDEDNSVHLHNHNNNSDIESTPHPHRHPLERTKLRSSLSQEDAFQSSTISDINNLKDDIDYILTKLPQESINNSCNIEMIKLLLQELNDMKLADRYIIEIKYDFKDIKDAINELKIFMDAHSTSSTFSKILKRRNFERTLFDYSSKLHRLMLKIAHKLNLSAEDRRKFLDGIDLLYSAISTHDLVSAGNLISEAFVNLKDYMGQYHIFLLLLSKTIQLLPSSESTQSTANQSIQTANYDQRYLKNMKFIAKDYEDAWSISSSIYRLNAELSMVDKALLPMEDIINEEKTSLYTIFISGERNRKKLSITSSTQIPIQDEKLINRVDESIQVARKKLSDAKNTGGGLEAIERLGTIGRAGSIVARGSLGAESNPMGRLSQISSDMEDKRSESTVRMKVCLEKTFVTLLITQKDLFLRSSICLDDVINEIPHDTYRRLKEKLDELIKEKIASVVLPGKRRRQIKHQELHRELLNQSEKIDTDIRNNINEKCTQEHHNIFLHMNADSVSPGNDEVTSCNEENLISINDDEHNNNANNIHNNVHNHNTNSGNVISKVGKNMRRRYVQKFIEYVFNLSPTTDDYYDNKLRDVNLLMSRMNKCGNASSQAIYAQKVAFTQLLSTAEGLIRIFQDVGALRSATRHYADLIASANILYRSSAESLCIQQSLCPMAMIMKHFLPSLKSDLEKRQRYAIDIASVERRGKDSRMSVYNNKMEILTAKINRKLQYMTEKKLNENLLFEMLCASIISQFELFTYLTTKLSILIEKIRMSPLQLSEQMRGVQLSLNSLNDNSSRVFSSDNGINTSATTVKSAITSERMKMVEQKASRLSRASLGSTFRKSYASRRLSSVKINISASDDSIGEISRLDSTELYDVKLNDNIDECFLDYYCIARDSMGGTPKYFPFVTARRSSSITLQQRTSSVSSNEQRESVLFKNEGKDEENSPIDLNTDVDQFPSYATRNV